ncbi:MAG: hypothetical protein QW558_00030 [Desulfurococcaceae archaeon]
MDRLVFENIPLEYLSDVLDTLVITPLIGDVEVEFNKPIDILFKYSAQRLPDNYQVFSERVFYIIHYPQSFLKIGSSSIHSVVGRIFSQAPYTGSLSIAVMLKREMSIEEMESIEEDCANYLNHVLKHEINTDYGDKDIEVHYRREKVFNESFRNYLKNLVNGKVETNISIELLGEISELMAEYVLRKYENTMGPLFPPNICLFKTTIDEEGVRILKEILLSKPYVSLCDLNELRRICINRNCKGNITILKNGVCILKTKINDLEKYFITPCDVIQYNLLIKIC